ncbi:hypothetical protein OH76DRAFT_536754 [Lentinus brumalis]|uniref:Uncharacterized protein n=1 Tax=Lentinus brumalis TaxID=2498619 RepID=A0A371DAG1_9APHY|nr:hypothetical protein OH76DRAFT_536754 [Polyporus brumalis]
MSRRRVSMLECIKSFERLATLKTKGIRMRPPRDRSSQWLRRNLPGASRGIANPRPRCRYCGGDLHTQEQCPHRPTSILSDILACIRSGPRFRRLGIDLHPSHLISYHTTRPRLPELIFDEDTRTMLHNLPGLEECLLGFGSQCALTRIPLFVTIRLKKGNLNYEYLWLEEPHNPEVEDIATSVPDENIPSACIYHTHAYY